MRKISCAFLYIVLLSRSTLGAQYPQIMRASVAQDPLYRQHQQDIEAWYAGDEELPLTLFFYTPKDEEDLFSVAAAFNLPYATLATLNGWSSPLLFPHGQSVLIPNIPGLFIPQEAQKEWELSLVGRHETEPRTLITPDGRSLLFYPGLRLPPGERKSFLGRLFTRPLNRIHLTSAFGYRPHPFTGRMSFHPGVDLRAAIGTEVLAAREGRVSQIGSLEIYGRFVILDHEGGFQTVYAHLDEVLVKPNQWVMTGERIAHSGNTGISTGPHLHFEIRKDGVPVDPSRLASLFNE
ncbi:MAG: M23 family metallopeptidase [Spirochaetales bacterium]|nr:M23 family metallopeptidase [Spirochaetales bacterium]